MLTSFLDRADFYDLSLSLSSAIPWAYLILFVVKVICLVFLSKLEAPWRQSPGLFVHIALCRCLVSICWLIYLVFGQYWHLKGLRTTKKFLHTSAWVRKETSRALASGLSYWIPQVRPPLGGAPMAWCQIGHALAKGLVLVLRFWL
jgi:hypothetical protein